jgi:hypothetical protein
LFQPFWAPDVHHKCCAEDLYGWRVIALAGHKALSTTQRYIEADVEAQKRVVACIGLWDPGGAVAMLMAPDEAVLRPNRKRELVQRTVGLDER